MPTPSTALMLTLHSLLLPGAVTAFLPRPLGAQDLSRAEITVAPVRGEVHMIAGAGGNIAVSLGVDGVFVVDAGVAELGTRVLAAIAGLAQRETANPDIHYLVNTHWHFDHTGANAVFAAAGATIVAHENVWRLMSEDQTMAALGGREIPAASEDARPRLTFSDRVNLSWNGDLIHVVHIANAHSNGDAIVHFRDADVVHTGDIVFAGRYPYIDVDFGGGIGGIVSALDEILAHTRETTLFVPGHGPLASREDVLAYRNMLATVQDRVQDMIVRGMTREEAIAAKPTADLDAVWSGEGTSADADFWVGLVYDGMRRSREQ